MILTNCNVWSPDGEWIAFDTRSDPAGDTFDGTRIQMVHVRTQEVRTLYESKNGANCGVVTWHPTEPKLAFILGPENPMAEFGYGPTRRQGVIVDARNPGVAINLDARDLVPPYTPGALRGGSHVHVWHPAGDWVSFTYDDDVLNSGKSDRRTVGVAVPVGAVHVGGKHPRNHDGTHFSVAVVAITDDPTPGSDGVMKAFEDAWVGGRRMLAFQGHVRTPGGDVISEVFVVELPEDLRVAGDGPLQGTPTTRPNPPRGCVQRRLTFTAGRKYPGIRGPRHWLRSDPAGTRIGFLMFDDDGVPQLWTVSPTGGEAVPVSRLPAGVESAFTWSADGKRIALVSDGRVAVVDAITGEAKFLTERGDPVRPEACVFAPDGAKIAFVRNRGGANQIGVVDVPG